MTKKKKKGNREKKLVETINDSEGQEPLEVYTMIHTPAWFVLKWMIGAHIGQWAKGYGRCV
jgi:hypothetical protein